MEQIRYLRSRNEKNENFRKDKLYIALKCADRIRSYLQDKGLRIDSDFDDFLDDSWQFLRDKKTRLPLVKIDKEISRRIIDEQDADFRQSLVNRYYYVLSDLILFLKENDPRSVDALMEEALEFTRYDAANDYLTFLGGEAVVLDDSDEEKIESDVRVVREKELQEKDIAFSRIISDWPNVIR